MSESTMTTKKKIIFSFILIFIFFAIIEVFSALTLAIIKDDKISQERDHLFHPLRNHTYFLNSIIRQDRPDLKTDQYGYIITPNNPENPDITIVMTGSSGARTPEPYVSADQTLAALIQKKLNEEYHLNAAVKNLAVAGYYTFYEFTTLYEYFEVHNMKADLVISANGLYSIDGFARHLEERVAEHRNYRIYDPVETDQINKILNGSIVQSLASLGRYIQNLDFYTTQLLKRAILWGEKKTRKSSKSSLMIEDYKTNENVRSLYKNLLNREYENYGFMYKKSINDGADYMLALTIVISIGVIEVMLRVKNSDGQNYHIEMWKYSKELKHKSDNPVLGHEHIPNKSAELQNVNIRINSKGMRGEDIPAYDPAQRRILFLGSSATLGWGIEEEETLSSQLQAQFDADQSNAVVMNAGIGNYNAQRYVTLFLTKNTDVKPTDIVVNYYPNDAEILEAGGGNFLIRHSQLAVTFWLLYNRFIGQAGHTDLLDHYQSIYKDDFEGFQIIKKSLEDLAKYAKENNIRLYLMMMPEVHDLEDYKYEFVHEIMKEIANDSGYTYIDALPSFQKIEDTESLWAMPGDPHPNALAHKIFADTLYPVLKKAR